MEMNRRSFLRGALVVTGAAVLPAAVMASHLPTIYGDGIHDDAPGLNALFAGAPVNIENKSVAMREGAKAILRGGHYRVASPIRFQGDIDVSEALFEGAPDFDAKDERYFASVHGAAGDMSRNFFNVTAIPEGRKPEVIILIERAFLSDYGLTMESGFFA